jgi:hypothetical protein
MENKERFTYIAMVNNNNVNNTDNYTVFETVSLYSSGRPGTHYEAQAGLELSILLLQLGL